MDRLINEYKSRIDVLHERLLNLEVLTSVPVNEINSLESEVIHTLKKIVAWYGPVSIKLFGYDASRQASKLILICNSDLRFQNLYFHLLLQDRRNFTQSDISGLARKLGLKLEGKQH